MRNGYVYFLTNKRKTALYIGVTSNIRKRIEQHKYREACRFTKKYNISILIHYEKFESIEDAIFREKYYKGKTRAKKEQVIATRNPEWKDLSREIENT